MNVKLVTINDETVQPIKTPSVKLENIKGYKLFPDLYCNIFLCAKKKSGKTSVINKIIRECSDKETIFHIFCSTHNKDDNWKEIKKWLDDKKRIANFYTSLTEDKLNILDVIVEDLRTYDEEEEKEEAPEEDKIVNFHEDEKYMTFKIKKQKPKKVAPKVMFIFDDFSGELKDKTLVKLLKEHRHYKTKVIISSQYPNDLLPESRSQIDYWLLFGGHSENKLEEIYKNCNLSITFEEFKAIYDLATSEKYHFLYINRNTDDFRKDFNSQIIF